MLLSYGIYVFTIYREYRKRVINRKSESDNIKKKCQKIGYFKRLYFFCRAMVATNYESITSKHYKPYKSPDGKEVLPNSSVQVGSGFVRQKPVTIPTVDEVNFS